MPNPEKLAIISSGINHWEKVVEKRKKNLGKWSDKLKKAHKSDTSIKRRRKLRIKRDNAAKELRYAKNTVRIGYEMKKEIMGKGKDK